MRRDDPESRAGAKAQARHVRVREADREIEVGVRREQPPRGFLRGEETCERLPGRQGRRGHDRARRPEAATDGRLEQADEPARQPAGFDGTAAQRATAAGASERVLHRHQVLARRAGQVVEALRDAPRAPLVGLPVRARVVEVGDQGVGIAIGRFELFEDVLQVGRQRDAHLDIVAPAGASDR